MSASGSTRFCHPLTSGALIKRIPKAARQSCATILTEKRKKTVKESKNLDNRTNLLVFESKVLRKQKSGGTKRNLTNKIKKRIADYENDVGVEDESLDTHQKQRKINSEEQLAKAITAMREDGNFKAALRLIGSEDNPAIPSVETRDELQQKHPPKPPDTRDPPPPNQGAAQKPLTVTSAIVLEEILSFPAGSSGGPDGLTPQHLKDLVADNTNSKLLEAVMWLVNLILAGELDQEFNEIIYGGRLIALKKKDEGLRPIAICYTVRCLAAKCANRYATAKLASHLAPIQLGIGTPGGAEAAIHSVR